MAPFHTISNCTVSCHTIRNNHVPLHLPALFNTILPHPTIPHIWYRPVPSRAIARHPIQSRIFQYHLSPPHHFAPFSTVPRDSPQSHTILQYLAQSCTTQHQPAPFRIITNQFAPSRIIMHHSHHPQQSALISTILHYHALFRTIPHQFVPSCITQWHPASSLDIPHYPAKEIKSRIIGNWSVS